MTNLQKKLTGTGVALVTPFHKNGSVDFKSLSKIVEHVIKGKCEYLVPLGTTGESVTLTDDERRAVVECVLEANNKRVPVVLGVGGNNTHEILNKLRYDSFEGISAILSVSPYYNKPNQKGIIHHYRLIAEESPVPVVLYNVPGRTGSNVTAETTLELAHSQKNIIGIKEASGNMEQIMSVIKDKPSGFLVISGDDAITLPLIAAGADGVISVVANAFPKHFSEMVHLGLNKKAEEAYKLHYLLADAIDMIFEQGNPAGIKEVFKALGLAENTVRLPLVNVDENLANRLKDFTNKISGM